ncbi:MAG TPA: hypothetical protein VFE54_09640, partial [Mucilaginibacter sp.]|jgi:plasmid maintenance system antidote protein VapI|nr:hypothetical protein [Mucilaginibacter sp.]
VKNLIAGGYIKTFREIIDTLPKTVIAQDLKMHHNTFSKLVDNPDLFTFKDAYRIAALIETEPLSVINLIYQQCESDKKARKKKG